MDAAFAGFTGPWMAFGAFARLRRTNKPAFAGMTFGLTVPPSSVFYDSRLLTAFEARSSAFAHCLHTLVVQRLRCGDNGKGRHDEEACRNRDRD